MFSKRGEIATFLVIASFTVMVIATVATSLLSNKKQTTTSRASEPNASCTQQGFCTITDESNPSKGQCAQTCGNQNKCDIAGGCNAACCQGNADCPLGQQCGGGPAGENGYCQSGKSCNPYTGVPDTGVTPTAPVGNPCGAKGGQYYQQCCAETWEAHICQVGNVYYCDYGDGKFDIPCSGQTGCVFKNDACKGPTKAPTPTASQPWIPTPSPKPTSPPAGGGNQMDYCMGIAVCEAGCVSHICEQRDCPAGQARCIEVTPTSPCKGEGQSCESNLNCCNGMYCYNLTQYNVKYCVYYPTPTKVTVAPTDICKQAGQSCSSPRECCPDLFCNRTKQANGSFTDVCGIKPTTSVPTQPRAQFTATPIPTAAIHKSPPTISQCLDPTGNANYLQCPVTELIKAPDGMTDIWLYRTCPASGKKDDSCVSVCYNKDKTNIEECWKDQRGPLKYVNANGGLDLRVVNGGTKNISELTIIIHKYKFSLLPGAYDIETLKLINLPPNSIVGVVNQACQWTHISHVGINYIWRWDGESKYNNSNGFEKYFCVNVNVINIK